MSMLVTSQLSFQTTKFAIISFQPGLVPPPLWKRFRHPWFVPCRDVLEAGRRACKKSEL